MKITKQRIREETLHHRGSSYQGPSGFTVPIPFMMKRMKAAMFNRLVGLSLGSVGWSGREKQ